MKDLIVYIDESGNVGDVAGEAPFGQQPTFAVAALAEERGSDAVASVIAELAAKHRLQPGELSARRFKNKPSMMTSFVRELLRAGVAPFVELMDKRYYVANNIVTWCLCTGWRDFSDEQNLADANALAEVLATELGDVPLLAYAKLAKSPSREAFDTFVAGVRRSIAAAQLATRDAERSAILEFMSAALEHAFDISKTISEEEVCERFVQPPDASIGGHRLGLLPHVQALSTLCARVNAFSRGSRKVLLMHDEQKEFAGVLRETFSMLTSNEAGDDLNALASTIVVDWHFPNSKFELVFADSEHHPGIQAADVLAGFCTRRMNAVVTHGHAETSLDAAAGLLGDLTEPAGVNFVSTLPRIEQFLGRRSVRFR